VLSRFWEYVVSLPACCVLQAANLNPGRQPPNWTIYGMTFPRDTFLPTNVKLIHHTTGLHWARNVFSLIIWAGGGTSTSRTGYSLLCVVLNQNIIFFDFYDLHFANDLYVMRFILRLPFFPCGRPMGEIDIGILMKEPELTWQEALASC
jgi:hypothetical protein